MTALSFTVESILVEDIFVVGTRRPVDDGAVESLSKSIAEIGLQTPITVRVGEVSDPDGEVFKSYILIAGAHRLEAYRHLGESRIPAIVRNCDEVDAELWEISENLHRLDLTKDQRDAQIRRFAELLEKKERSEKPSQNATVSHIGGRGNKGIVAKVSEKTGVSKDTVRRALNPKPDPEPLSDEEAENKQFRAFLRLWNRSGSEVRQRIRDHVDAPIMDRRHAA